MPDFSPAAYRALLDALSGLGYTPASFTDGAVEGRRIILRHDVDVSLERAASIAQIERNAGWTATYYVMVSTDLYNLGSAAERAHLARIASAGHEIGLHFDVTVLGDVGRDALEAAARAECDWLASVTGKAVTSLSFHRPAPFLQGMEGNFAGLPHSYQPRFFTAIDYCSDSGGSWRNGHPLDRDAIANGQPMQLLTHPIWWTGEAYENVDSKLEEMLAERVQSVRAELWRNIKPV